MYDCLSWGRISTTLGLPLFKSEQKAKNIYKLFLWIIQHVTGYIEQHGAGGLVDKCVDTIMKAQVLRILFVTLFNTGSG